MFSDLLNRVKVKTLLEDHKIWKKSCTCFDIYSVMSKQVEDFWDLTDMKISWTLKIGLTPLWLIPGLIGTLWIFLHTLPSIARGHSITTRAFWTWWGGQKISVFVHAHGIKTVHVGGEGIKKWQNSVHVVVEWPLI